MKIYTRIVIDIETGMILSEDFFEYGGPVALCTGGGDVDVPTAYEMLEPPSPEEQEMYNYLQKYIMSTATDEEVRSEEFRSWADETLFDWFKAGQPLPEDISPAMKTYIAESERLATEIVRDALGEQLEKDYESTINDLASRRVLPSTVASGTLKRLGEKGQEELADASTAIALEGMNKRIEALNTERDMALNKMGLLQDVRAYEAGRWDTVKSNKVNLAYNAWNTQLAARHNLATNSATNATNAAMAEAQNKQAQSSAIWGALGTAAGVGGGIYASGGAGAAKGG